MAIWGPWPTPTSCPTELAAEEKGEGSRAWEAPAIASPLLCRISSAGTSSETATGCGSTAAKWNKKKKKKRNPSNFQLTEEIAQNVRAAVRNKQLFASAVGTPVCFKRQPVPSSLSPARCCRARPWLGGSCPQPQRQQILNISLRDGRLLNVALQFCTAERNPCRDQGCSGEGC